MSPRKSTANADSSARSDGRVAAEASNSDASLSIGELARRTGVSTRTIRYYEELGILPSPQRTDGGTRRYPREYIFYVEGARTLKELGFGLEEIAELGKFALTGQWDSGRSQSILTRKLAELEHRIRVLNRLHDLVVEASKSSSKASGKGKGKSKADVPPLLRWVGEERRDEEAAAGTK